MKHVNFCLFCAALALLMPFISEAQESSENGLIKVECKVRNKNHPEQEKWVAFPSMTVDNLPFDTSKADRLNRYGSFAEGPVFKATGFYYPAKYEDRWILVDPEGHLHIDAVVNGVIPGRGETNKEYFAKKFKTKDNWVKKTGDMLLKYGFNGAGNWSSEESLQYYNSVSKNAQLSYCANLSLMSGYGKQKGVTVQRPGNTGYPNQCILIFDPDFEKYCEKKVHEAVKKYKADPNLMGYFSDNEMPLSLKNLEGYLDLPADDWGHKAAEEWLAGKGMVRENITDELRSEFAGFVAEKYYSTVNRILKKYDPDHMYLGSRLHGGAKYIREVIEAAARWCDVVSINYYAGWDVRKKDADRWDGWMDKPWIITEFYTKGEDSGMANTTGAGWLVHTQNDRGIHYENFIISLLKTRGCVGWHWFKYQDNDPTAKGVDPSNIDSNKGLVNNKFEPYGDLVKRMKRVNEVRYTIMNEFNRK